jgi:diamine N-acetyltransferase
VEQPLIRPAGEGDIPALSAIAERTWADAFGDGLPAADVAAELKEGRSHAFFSEALRTTTILVAECGGVLAGYVQAGDVEIAGFGVRPGDSALRRLYVDTPLQGGGIGRRLLDAALAHEPLASAGRVVLQVWEENDRAVRLYEAAGFRRVGTTTFTVGSQVVEDLVMVLDRRPTGRSR